MAKEIQLTQGKVVLVSDHRFEHLNQWEWCALKRRNNYGWYAVRGANHGLVYMHRQIANAPRGMKVDHWDRDGLNNQDENLRVCTNSQNQSNREKNRTNTTGFKGVTWARSGKPYRAQIDGVHIGVFDDPAEAARAYDREALKQYGPFARLNFPEHR